MADHGPLDRLQLEAATSRKQPSGAALGGETSALRDGFMALGRAVEAAADADFDEAALVARVQAMSAVESAPIRPVRAVGINWPVLLSGALAAAALIALVRIAANLPESDQIVIAPRAATQDSTLPHEQGFADNGSSDPASDSANLAWDDPLDDEIAAAQSNLADLSGRLTGIDGSLSNMNQTLEALSDDLSGESL